MTMWSGKRNESQCKVMVTIDKAKSSMLVRIMKLYSDRLNLEPQRVWMW